MSEQNRVRASDAERERVVSVLRNAISEGRLTLQEGEERMAAAYATVYRDELPGLTADLPPADPPPAQRRRAERARGRRGQPVAGLVALAAVVAGIWALAGGLVIWPAIVLGILAVMLSKSGPGRGRGWCQWSGPDQWSRRERWPGRDQASV